jgi:hypothetical protein
MVKNTCTVRNSLLIQPLQNNTNNAKLELEPEPKLKLKMKRKASDSSGMDHQWSHGPRYDSFLFDF